MTGKKIEWPPEVIIYTDGASRGNPGPASIGIHVAATVDETVLDYAEVLGVQTNNYAEYTGVLRALQLALENDVRRLCLRSDSELMVQFATVWVPP